MTGAPVAAHCAFHPDGDPRCTICIKAGELAADVQAAPVVELAPPSSYCSACARPRGGEHHPDECVCAGTDAAGDGLPRLVHVPGGQRAALDRLAAAPAYNWTRTLTSTQVDAALRSLKVRGPRTPLVVEVTATERGWRVRAHRPAGQLTLLAEPAGEYRADLPACGCDREPCVRTNCADYGHCHKTSWGERHAEHVEAFCRSIAREHHGPVTISPVPRRDAPAGVR